MIRVLGTIFAGLLGLAFGSFLNVCLSRWPEGESIVQPRSHCRSCGRTLAWWENVPLLSWIALRGRCRSCGAWIGWRYPLVELAVGALWAVAAWRVLANTASPVPFDLRWAVAIYGQRCEQLEERVAHEDGEAALVAGDVDLARRAPPRRRPAARPRPLPRPAVRIRSHSSSRLESTARTIVRRNTSISSTSGVFAGAGTRLHERLVGVAQVPEQRALGATELVLADVLVEVHEALEHLARDRLGPDVVAAHPGVLAREGVEGVVDELAQRLGVLELLELLDALLVLDARRLELAELHALEHLELLAQDEVGVLEDGLDDPPQSHPPAHPRQHRHKPQQHPRPTPAPAPPPLSSPQITLALPPKTKTQMTLKSPSPIPISTQQNLPREPSPKLSIAQN